jgi:putative endonuclease
MPADKRFVYVLRSEGTPPRYYIGLSAVLAPGSEHNALICRPTSKYGPWRTHVTIEFAEQELAARFERYLKSGSGRAFASRYFGVSLAASALNTGPS